MADSLTSFFQDEDNRATIEQLMEVGFLITSAKNKAKDKNQPLQDYVILFTGKLQSMSRSEAKKMVKDGGGKVVSSLSKKVTHLVTGDKAGSKLKKAKEMGIKIITENDFQLLLKG